MSVTNADLRRWTLEAIDRFCAREGFATPPLTETRDGQWVRFVAAAPDGREFTLSYEESPE